MLKKKELLCMQTLEKLTVVTNLSLSILCGDRDLSTTRKRMQKLIGQGYVTSINNSGHSVYTLTKKGLIELEKTREPYIVKGKNCEHLEYVSLAASWLYIKTNISIQDMIFDRAIQKFKLQHSPDIIFSNFAIEVELTPKSLNRLDRNFRLNADNFKHQTWIIPARLNVMKSHIIALSKKYNSKINIVTIEDMLTDIKSYNLKTNATRYDALRKMPSPVITITRKEVDLDD